MLDHLGQLETAHPRHLDVEHEEGEFLDHQREERLFGGFDADQPVARVLQDGFEHGQVSRLIIHEQDIDELVVQGGRGVRRTAGVMLAVRVGRVATFHQCFLVCAHVSIGSFG